MNTFSEELREYLLELEYTEVYIESFPAPANTELNIIGIISAGEIFNSGNPELLSFIKRFVVSGSSTSAYRKAHDLFETFYPSQKKPIWLNQSSFEIPSFIVKKVFPEKAPSITKNIGNIFLVDFVLRFLVAKKK
jgi:trehalose utilization protein